MKFAEKLAFLSLIFFFLNEYSTAQTTSSSTQHLDRSKLEAAEDQAEVLANQMLELSRALSAFNTTQVASFFTNPSWVTPLPTEATDLVPEVKWVQRHGWRTLANKTRKMSQEDIIRMWDDFLAHFSELEDARFKVAKATFDEHGTSGAAALEFFLIGRNPDGLREWVRGIASVTLKRAES